MSELLNSSTEGQDPGVHQADVDVIDGQAERKDESHPRTADSVSKASAARPIAPSRWSPSMQLLTSPPLTPREHLNDEHSGTLAQQSCTSGIQTSGPTIQFSSSSIPCHLVIELSPPAVSLIRTESAAIENEVLTYRSLTRAGIPTPSILRVVRDRRTRCIVSALLEQPPGISLNSAPWRDGDIRWQHSKRQLETAHAILKLMRARHFGPVAAVAAGKGYSTWHAAFAGMFNALLMDAEDAFVNLPYSRIRALIRATMGIDTAIGGYSNVEACLVVPGFGAAANVVVDQFTGDINACVASCRDAYWGDPEMMDGRTRDACYVLYQGVKAVVLGHIRPEPQWADKVIEARSRIIQALERESLHYNEESQNYIC